MKEVKAGDKVVIEVEADEQVAIVVEADEVMSNRAVKVAIQQNQTNVTTMQLVNCLNSMKDCSEAVLKNEKRERSLETVQLDIVRRELGVLDFNGQVIQVLEVGEFLAPVIDRGDRLSLVLRDRSGRRTVAVLFERLNGKWRVLENIIVSDLNRKTDNRYSILQLF